MTRPILRLDGIRAERNGVLILDDIDWVIEPGEHWAVLGLNGAGKSTLLQIILAQLPATAGSIELLGERYGHSDWREVRTRVGIVSQAFAHRIPRRESVSRIVASGVSGHVGTRRPLSHDEQVGAQPWLEVFGLAHRAEQPWSLLSQGEQQRTLIARAFRAQPELIILDEPCAGLDPVARHSLLQRLESAADDPASPSIIYVTHHIEEIRPVFTHVLGLANGRAVVNDVRASALQTAPLRSVYRHPVSVETDNTGVLRLIIPDA